MSKNKFSSLVRQRVNYTSFQYLLEKNKSRKFENAIGKDIEYSEVKMAEYLNSTETDMSIDEKKWLLKCRIENIDLIPNRKWNNEDIMCKNCPNEVFTQKHLLYCSYLLGKNELLTYIPDYKDLFNGEMEDQVYINRLLKENYMRMKDQKTM